MNIGTAVIVIVLVLFCIYVLWGYVRKLKKGGSCCDVNEEAEKKVKVKDKNKSHYSYEMDFKIDGMVCANCVRRVENALNSMEGTWAAVDLIGRRAKVLLKNKPDEDAVRKAVLNAGYTVIGDVEVKTTS